MTSFEQLVSEVRRRPVDVLLERLDGVQDRGRGQYYARCPAHEDKSPSLSIRETGDGTVLIHCFALCSPDEIVSAIGLDIADLFPTKLERRKGCKPRWNPRDVLLVIKHEATVIEIVAHQFDELDDEQIERVKLAGRRIRTALEVANVR